MDTINFIKKSFGFYFQDKESYEYIEKKISWQEAFITTIVFSFLISLISVGIESIYSNNSNFFVENLVSIILSSVLYLPLIILLIYGLTHFCFKLFNGKADFYDTLKFGVSISIFSTLLVALLTIFPTRFFSDNMKFIFDIIYTIILLAIFIWMLVISIRVYSRLHDLTVGKTVFALILPFLILLVLAAIIFMIMIMFFGATF